MGSKFRLTILEHCALNYEAQAEKISLNSASTHDWLFNEIKTRIDNPKAKTTFHQDFLFLKKERVDADYKTRIFSDVEALTCQEVAERLLHNIKSIR